MFVNKRRYVGTFNALHNLRVLNVGINHEEEKGWAMIIPRPGPCDRGRAPEGGGCSMPPNLTKVKILGKKGCF